MELTLVIQAGPACRVYLLLIILIEPQLCVARAVVQLFNAPGVGMHPLPDGEQLSGHGFQASKVAHTPMSATVRPTDLSSTALLPKADVSTTSVSASTIRHRKTSSPALFRLSP